MLVNFYQTTRRYNHSSPDDGGSKDLWNVGKLLPDYTALQSLIAPMMEAARTSETLVNFFQATRLYNPEDSHRHTHRHENLKSYLCCMYYMLFEESKLCYSWQSIKYINTSGIWPCHWSDPSLSCKSPLQVITFAISLLLDVGENALWFAHFSKRLFQLSRQALETC
jgi:hypothetical protein